MFRLEEFMGRRVLKSSLMDGLNVDAFFTTRDLPLKYGEREDLIEEVEENKKLVCRGFNIPIENLIIPQQTHSSNIGVISHNKKNCPPFENTDALITDEIGVAIALNFADCVPLNFYDPIKKIGACAHAGWRGTEAKIGVKTVQRMCADFGSEPQNIIALIGPSIGKCCFEVGEEVKAKLLKSLPETNTMASMSVCENNHIDLKLLNKIQLLAIGVKK